jgi:hypothetical protein
MKLFEILIAIICIFIAIYNFDIYSLNHCIISILLFMQAIMLLFRNKQLNKILTNISVALAVFLIMKILLGA